MSYIEYVMSYISTKETNMQIDYIVLADAAAALEGKHYIHGAGWGAIAGLSFPLTYPQIAVALRLRVPWNETNQQHRLEVDVVDADERTILPVPPGPLQGTLAAGRPVNLREGLDQVMPLVINLQGVQFAAPGTYAVKVRIDGMDKARATFEVMQLGAQVTLAPR
jgi:hypothetical protein